MPAAAPIPVVVAGAGPVGMTAALLLARYGLPVVLLERHRDSYPLPRAVHLDDEVVRILQAVGVADDFTQISRRGLGLRLLGADHRVLARFARDSRPGLNGYPQASMFDQPDLEGLLRARVRAHPGIELRTRHTLVGLDETGGVPAVRVQVADHTGAQTYLWAQAVLGCDGANSTVRDLIGSQYRDLGFTERWLVVDARCDQTLSGWDGVDQICDSDRPGTFMRVGDRRYRWEFRLRDGESADDLTTAAALAALLAPWLEDPRDVEIMRQSEYTFKARIADRWYAGRVFLAGDAAHLTPPFIGQGLGAGLRDVYNLCWKLADVLGGQAAESLLASYQAERAPHARGQIRLAMLLGWLMTRGGGIATGSRRLILPLLRRTPGVRGAVLSSRTPRLRLPGGRLPHLLGQLCPQPWVDDDGRRRRLDDVLGLGHALVTTTPVTDDLRRYAGQLGVPIVCVHPRGTYRVETGVRHVAELDDPPILLPWLTGRRPATVLLRPDRVVARVLRGRRQNVGRSGIPA